MLVIESKRHVPLLQENWVSFDSIKQAAAAGFLLIDATNDLQTIVYSCNDLLSIAAACSDVVPEGSYIVQVCMRLFHPA